MGVGDCRGGGMEGYRYLVGCWVLWEVGSGIGEFLPCRGRVPPLLHVSHGCEHSPFHFGDLTLAFQILLQSGQNNHLVDLSIGHSSHREFVALRFESIF